MTYSQNFALTALTAPPGAPSVYRGYIPNNPSDTAFTAGWYAPTTGTGPFTYNVSVALSGTGNYTQSATGLTSRGYQWTGLTANTQYDFAVAAVDAARTEGALGTVTQSTAPTLPTGAQAFWYSTYYFPLQHLASTTYAEIYYDCGSTGITSQQGQTAGSVVSGLIDNIYTNLAKLFGWSYPVANNIPLIEDPNGTKIHIILSNSAISSSAGAAHLWSQDTDIFVNQSPSRNADSFGNAITCELDEAYMSSLKGLPASDYHSMGEALSIALAYQLFPGDSADPAYYARSWLNQSPRTDWVNTDAGYLVTSTTDWQYAIGCQAMFLNWLRHKGNTWQSIFGSINAITPSFGAAPNLSCTPRDIYNQLTGGTAYNPLADFLADVATQYPVGVTVTTGSIDPWNTAPTYVTPSGTGP